MYGGIKFFDIDPENTAREKNIVINYLGKDYYPSTIKFAPDNGSQVFNSRDHQAMARTSYPSLAIAASLYIKSWFLKRSVQIIMYCPF